MKSPIESLYKSHKNPIIWSILIQIDPVLPHLMRYCVTLGRTEELARRRRSEDCGLVQSVPRSAVLPQGSTFVRIRVSRSGDTPIAWGFIIENPIKMDDLRVPPFQEMPK